MTSTLLQILVDASLRAVAVALPVAAILQGLRVRAGGVRHAAWTAVLCAMLLMPVLPYCLPGVQISLWSSWPRTTSAEAFTREAEPPALSPVPLAARVADPSHQASSGIGVTAPRPLTVATDGTHRPWRLRPLAAVAIYLIGALVMSFRYWLGWRGAARIADVATPVALPRRSVILRPAVASVVIRESPSIATPVVVGVISPCVLLPTTWTLWSTETLQAILAHELAHVRRRDPLIGLLARVNRVVFWFHPLAWWLERTLAASAEHASDDEAVRTIGGGTRYADILIEMARTVRERGGRISWEGVGINGTGVLGRRIDRILRGDPWRTVSTIRKCAVAASCAATILLVVACRPQSPSSGSNADASIEQRDHKLRVDLRKLPTGHPFTEADWAITPSRLEALEAALEKDPDDLGTLKELLVGYWVLPAPEKRRAHILRLIEHHPDAALAGSIEARIFPSDRYPTYAASAPLAKQRRSFAGDPDGYAQAKALWLAHASRPDASAEVLGNAAYFLEAADKPLAERMLLRANTLDPLGPWSARLGRFYAIVLSGSQGLTAPNTLATLSPAEPRSPYGVAVRTKLGESTDDALLTATGWFLARSSRRPWMEIDPDVWAEACLKRALQVNPGAILAHAELLNMSRQRTRAQDFQTPWIVPPALQYAHVSALPETERFEQLPEYARNAYAEIEDLSRWDDPNLRSRVELARDQARHYAEDALALASRYSAHPKYGTAVYMANMTLGAVSLRDGDRKKAVEYLRRAARAPASEELRYAEDVVWGRHWHLAADLLKQGEREAVTDFLERMARINLIDRTELREAAAAIRRGETPRLPS